METKRNKKFVELKQILFIFIQFYGYISITKKLQSHKRMLIFHLNCETKELTFKYRFLLKGLFSIKNYIWANFYIRPKNDRCTFLFLFKELFVLFNKPFNWYYAIPISNTRYRMLNSYFYAKYIENKVFLNCNLGIYTCISDYITTVCIQKFNINERVAPLVVRLLFSPLKLIFRHFNLSATRTSKMNDWIANDCFEGANN